MVPRAFAGFTFTCVTVPSEDVGHSRMCTISDFGPQVPAPIGLKVRRVFGQTSYLRSAALTWASVTTTPIRRDSVTDQLQKYQAAHALNGETHLKSGLRLKMTSVHFK
jgi:hypothetical protein